MKQTLAFAPKHVNAIPRAILSTLRAMATKKTVNLEKSLADLEALVEELESGDLPLEKAMKKFEQGIKLTRECQTALKDVEQKVEVLVQNASGDSLEDFTAEAD